MRRFACVTSVLLCFAGCADPEAASKGAGATGVLRQEFRIDGHEHELLPIRAIAVSHDGTIAMFPFQQVVFQLFTAKGDPIGSVGREGDGPGEFRFVTSFGWRADSLWVYDEKHRRLTLIPPSLSTGRIIAHLPRSVFGLTPDGSLLLKRAQYEWPEALLRLPTIDSSGVPLLEFPHVDSARIPLLELPHVDAERVYVRTPAGGLVLPMSNLPIAAFAADGSRVAGAMASLEGEDAGTFLLTAVDAAGDTIFARRYPFEPEVITDAVADSFLDAFVAMGEARDAPPAVKTWAKIIRSSVRVPPMWPPLLGLVIANDGSIWVELRKRADSPRYYVVAADGEPLGTVVLPEDSRLGAATKDRVWLIEKDELDVESIVRYAVDWQTGTT